MTSVSINMIPINWLIVISVTLLLTFQLTKSEVISPTYSNVTEGREIKNCEPGYYGFPNCTLCACDPIGSVNETCDSIGRCTCVPRFGGPKCNHCGAGYHNFPKCEACNCDLGGSLRRSCDARTGSCRCRFRIEGRRCDRPQKAHYYHTTYQYLYELEDGHNVHYDYNETVFPGFSWKGYAKFSDLQKKVIIDFPIGRSSFYQVILNYHNPGTEPIVGNLTLSNENEPPQHIKITFPPTSAPKKYLLSMDKTSPLYLFATQRPWKASLSADEPLLVDYIVFLPQAYFEASILRENVTATGTVSFANFSNHLELPIVDKSTEFLKHCVQDAFHIDDSSSEFCKQALFTLTTGLNNGGAFCSCNAQGSKGFTCNPLGGQCDCKPNVIGRTCKACRSDYYGFPDCKPCNCTKTAAYCEPVTGECVCPKNLTGSDCNPLGTTDDICNTENGQC